VTADCLMKRMAMVGLFLLIGWVGEVAAQTAPSPVERAAYTGRLAAVTSLSPSNEGS